MHRCEYGMCYEREREREWERESGREREIR